MKKLSFFFFLLSFFFHLLSARPNSQRNYLFENISILEGLSSEQVQYIFQDSNGYLWISTSDGLNRYDGFAIKVFKNDPNDSLSLPGNYCGAITEDAEGYLWVGIFGNTIARFNPKIDRFKAYTIDSRNLSLQSEQLGAITDSKGNVWFTTSNYGIQRYNKAADRFEKIRLDSVETPGSQWGQVYDIIELKNGNILACDYGSNVKIYNAERDVFQTYYLKTNYSPEEVMKIFEDNSGNIWFISKGKLVEYSPVYFTTEIFDLTALLKVSEPGLSVQFDYLTGIEQDNDGFIWITQYSDGLFRFDPQKKEFRRFSFSSTKSDMGQEVVWQLFKDKYGVIWIGSWFNGLTKFDPLREPFNYTKITQEKDVNSAVSTVTGISGTRKSPNIMIGTSANGLFSYNLETKTALNLNDRLQDFNGQDIIINIQNLLVDEQDNTWFSFNGLGLFEFNGSKITAIPSPHKGKTTGYIVNDMKMDLSANLWIASRYGFEIYNHVKKNFSLLPTIMNKKISPDLRGELNNVIQSRQPFASILKAGEASNLEKKFSIGEDKKVLIICMGEGRIISGNDGMFDTGSLMTMDRNIVWSMDNLLETFNAGGGFKNRLAIKCLDLKKGDYKLTFVSDVGHSYGNWNVLPPADSSWWGIQILEINDAEFSRIQSLNENEINTSKYLPMEVGNSIEISKKFYNIIWLGSLSNGFFKYNNVTGDYKQYRFDMTNKSSPDNSVPYIYEDREGIVWLATRKNLVRFDPVSEKMQKFEQKDGLPSGIINSVVEDLQGNLWISTAAGLSKFNKNAPKEKWNFVNFDSKDGLQKYSSSKANWVTEDGKIILGASDGLISFYPGKINTVKPDVIIEDIKISNISLKTDSATVIIGKAIPRLDNLELSYRQNNISFEFASIHFSRPAKNKLMYYLEGFNNKWTTTDRNFASFTNLHPGEYVFRIKGSNGDGIWNEEGREIKINILPPWWQTTYAYVLYVVLFAALIFGIDRIQRRRLLAKARAANAIKEAELRAQLAEAENERKSRELEEARALQLSMLPKELPQLPNLDIAVYMQTATEVGGDYYDFHVGMDGTLTVVIGDATGHGMKAGTMVTTAKSLFNSYAPNPDILYSFQEITRCIKQMNFGKLSMCLTMLKIKGDKMQISSAGMPPSLIFRRDTQIVEEHMFKAMPLGTMEKFPYEMQDTTLKSGDTILLISDGLPELANNAGEMYGYKRIRNGFEDMADKSPDEIISFMKNEGASWVNNEDPDDDVTFVVIKVK